MEVGSDRSSVTHGHHPGTGNGKTTGFASILPPSDMQYSHQQKRTPTNRPPDPILPQDIQIMKVLTSDKKQNGGGEVHDVNNGAGRRRSSTNSNKQQLSPQNIPQQHRPHPHARPRDVSKQNIIAHNQKQAIIPPKSSSGGKLDKEENVIQYYPNYNPHNPNATVRPPDSPETFGWAYGVGDCASNHCSNCVINTTGHKNGHHQGPGGQTSYNNANTNSLNR